MLQKVALAGVIVIAAAFFSLPQRASAAGVAIPGAQMTQPTIVEDVQFRRRCRAWFRECRARWGRGWRFRRCMARRGC
jgi:hypothetical protein